MLSSGCSAKKSEPVYIYKTDYLIPEKAVVPEAPEFLALDSKKSITSSTNFKHLQVNISLLKNYSNQLKDVITYYETAIDNLNKQKEMQIEENNNASHK